jgi:hypothetical protein
MKSTVLAPLGAIVLGLSVASIASAQEYDPDSKVAAELRFGPYRPDVDSAFNNAAPYQQVFGDSRRYMMGLEVDWQALHIPRFGSVGIGGSISYTKSTGTAQFSDGSTGSAEETSLTLYPMAALGVVRVDVLARRTPVPLVAYGKIGPGVAFWTAANGSGTSVGKDGKSGQGRTFGMVYAIGGAFLLDAFDRQAARSFSVEQGVHHSYFFLEYTITDYHGLGQSGAMYLGDKTWNLGLTFEM